MTSTVSSAASSNPINRAVSRCGGQRQLAEQLGVTPGLISQWVNGVRPVCAVHCRRIEAVTAGAVTRYQLRPDVFGMAPDSAAA